MNAKGLAKLYDKLIPRERLPLIIAATARGDDAERERLVRSAPRGCYELPDYHGLAQALDQVSLYHLARLLDLAARYWHTSTMLADAGAATDDEARTQRLWQTLHLLAYLLTTQAHGWARFCAEFPMDPELLLKDVPGYETASWAVEAARGLACPPEVMTERLRAEDGSATARTAEDVARDLWALIDGLAARWQ